MPNLTLAQLSAEIDTNVRRALAEDIGSGDITAQLIPAERLARVLRLSRVRRRSSPEPPGSMRYFVSSTLVSPCIGR